MRSRLLLVSVTLLLVLSACSSGEDSAEAADGAAQDLAEALASGDLVDVVFVDTFEKAAQKDYDETVESLGEVTPTVEVEELADQGDQATATLAWSWPLTEGQPWTYETEAELTRADDEWQVAWSRALVEPSLGPSSVLVASTVTALRGDIVGAGGRPLVTERSVADVGIDRSQVPAKAAGDSARQLAELVGVEAEPFVKAVEAAGELAFVRAITYRIDDLPPGVTDAYEAIPGARLVSGKLPLAPTKEFAAPILGTVGEVTAEMIEDDPETYRIGDRAGLSGLQARYDEQLRGVPGLVVQAVNRKGKERALFRVDEEAGEPLELTLDETLQRQAESLLGDVASASALVAMRPSDGAILAAANGAATEGQNFATYGQFAPGSTFKAVSSLALLRAGLTPDSVVECPSSLSVDGKSFTNYSDYPADALGSIPLRTAVANSCNTALIGQRDRLDDGALADAAATLGLGVDHDLGFPAYFGSVEPPASETEAAADMIGQGTVLASPMAMAAVIASVQQGELVVPRLVESVQVDDHDHEPLTSGEAGDLRAMLRAVVTEGSGSALADLPGAPVIAKTGTAEFQGQGGLQTHAWMIAAQGDLAVAVFIELGESGSGTAGPILEAFLRAAG